MERPNNFTWVPWFKTPRIVKLVPGPPRTRNPAVVVPIIGTGVGVDVGVLVGRSVGVTVGGFVGVKVGGMVGGTDVVPGVVPELQATKKRINNVLAHETNRLVRAECLSMIFPLINL